MKKPLNNLPAFCIATFKPEPLPEGVSTVVGRPVGQWEIELPAKFYNSLPELIADTPDFNPKTHLVCEVIMHITGARVKIISS